ncbi:hypothetical protein QTO34_018584 [Cnephaeus nilssonii]|uniref:propanoyl-CoA C-acyltransferase n=1 Tax=Cnephaeus nilssonii TaxID=3371016 RepID=A0AA40LNY4_CNENI|nr:hypothetical protein QTO34_018584 [Eptesicus nilssonii]
MTIASLRPRPLRRVFVVGVGMTKFMKPGLENSRDYPDLAKEAGQKALADAQIPYSAVEQACIGYVYGDSTSGQRAIYHSLGLTGIPIINVNNNCSTGSTALFMARQLIQGGVADCVLALGFEKMEKGSLSVTSTNRTNPIDKHMEVLINKYELSSAPFAPQMFGGAGKEHMEKYGTKVEHFAKIGWKNHKHSVNNPYSQFQKEYSLDEVMNSRKVFDFLTVLQCCPTSDGAAAAILASEEFVQKYGLQSKAVEILAQEMMTDLPSSFEENSVIKMVGFDMSKEAARKCYEKSGLRPSDIDVIELHDCFSANELITYEALGLCPEGQGGKLVDRGDNTYGGKWVINPSGGLISKGHPLGATGNAAQRVHLLFIIIWRRFIYVPAVMVKIVFSQGICLSVLVLVERNGAPEEVNAKVEFPQPAPTTWAFNLFKYFFLEKPIFKNLDENEIVVVRESGSFLCMKISIEPGGHIDEWTGDRSSGRGSFVEHRDLKLHSTGTAGAGNLCSKMRKIMRYQTNGFQGILKALNNFDLLMADACAQLVPAKDQI